MLDLEVDSGRPKILKDRLNSLSQRFRSATGRLSSIVVTEVNRNNYEKLWPLMMISIRDASFISVDLELSGLGNFSASKDVNERYRAVREAAMTRSVVSLGVSTFKLIKKKETREKKRIRFKCQVFNLLTFCMSPFVVEPSGLQFLVHNKFDLNRLVKDGIPYDLLPKVQGNSLRLLFEAILEQNIPLVFHNGFVDLAFLYQHFYAQLPDSLSEFVANISDWFCGQRACLYDSKYFSEYCIRMKASFLEYVFRKCQRDNAVEASYLRLYVSIEFDDSVSKVLSLSDAIEIIDCRLPDGFYEAEIKVNFPNKQEKQSICPKYANYGFCKSRRECPLLHNVDAVLDCEEMKQAKLRMRRKRRYDFCSKSNQEKDSEETKRQSAGLLKEPASHRSEEQLTSDEELYYRSKEPYLKRSEIANRLPLPGKALPLIVRKCEHTCRTAEHLERWKLIQKERDNRN